MLFLCLFRTVALVVCCCLFGNAWSAFASQHAASVSDASASITSALQSGKKSSRERSTPVLLPSAEAVVQPIFGAVVNHIAEALHKENRIDVNTDAATERGTVKVHVTETQSVEIDAYNILGKKVADIYSGEAKQGASTIYFDLAPFSNGVYICVVRGKNFKTADKFFVTR